MDTVYQKRETNKNYQQDMIFDRVQKRRTRGHRVSCGSVGKILWCILSIVLF